MSFVRRSAPLLAGLACFLSLAAKAQTMPDYTFGPMGTGGIPSPFSSGGNGFAPMAGPNGFYGLNQSPFGPISTPRFGQPYAPTPRAPMGQYTPAEGPRSGFQNANPLPYWMQTPQNIRPQARFIDPITPAGPPPQYQTQGWASALPQASTPPPQANTPPPRWAPLSGVLPKISPQRRSTNNWRPPVPAPANTTEHVSKTHTKWYSQ